MKLSFSKWSPSGNTTLFFPVKNFSAAEQAQIARQTLSPNQLGAEQAGFVDPENKTLRMSGGEFCLNATRAFGTLLAYLDNKQTDTTFRSVVTVSGWPTPIALEVKGHAPIWNSQAELLLPSSLTVEEKDKGLTIVRLPGIVHILLDKDRHPAPTNEAEGKKYLAQMQKTFALFNVPCIGCIWWQTKAEQLEILPLVHVRETQTIVFEQSCGSGSLALALSLVLHSTTLNFSILQPEGSALAINISEEKNKVCVAGSVRLIAEGQVYLPELAH